MRTFIHGNDRGSALLAALVAILVLSAVFMTAAPKISLSARLARETKSRVIGNIELNNREAMENYELH